jgi:dTMP kinase
VQDTNLVRVVQLGYFITFEGVEGCGKTTQIRLLADCLVVRGFSVTLTREPGGCAISDKIRAILLDADNSLMSPLTELMLYAAARAQHVSDVIIPALNTGNVVLCDRFSDATVAYQSFGRGIDREVIEILNNHACQGVTPDMTVLIDCDPSVGLTRARRRIEASNGPREERFELEEPAFHQRVREGYQQLATEQSRRFTVIEGNNPVEDISKVIAMKVLERIPECLRVI